MDNQNKPKTYDSDFLTYGVGGIFGARNEREGEVERGGRGVFAGHMLARARAMPNLVGLPLQVVPGGELVMEPGQLRS